MSDARWNARIKQLERRLAVISEIAAGRTHLAVTSCDDCWPFATFDGDGPVPVPVKCRHPKVAIPGFGAPAILMFENDQFPPGWCPLREKPMLIELVEGEGDNREQQAGEARNP